MKQTFCLRIVAAGCAACLFIPSGLHADDQYAVSSPNGDVRLKVVSEAGLLKHEITSGGRFRSRPVIERSPIRISIDGTDLTAGVKFGEITRYKVNETYPWRGIHSVAKNHANGARVELKHNGTGTSWTLELRAFDDGVAFRHIIPGSEKSRVPGEATKFIVPAGSTVWHHDLGGHYEDVHERSAVDAIKQDEWIAPPMTFRLPGDTGYAAITEAALFNYSGMALQADGQRGFNVVLGHAHPISYPFRLRYSNDVARVQKPAAVSGTITSAWRVVLVGRDLNALVNSDIVHNLCPPPDPNLFPKGMQTDWIKPGRAVWRYLDGGRNTLEEVKDFSRRAGEMGFEYQVVEGFWSRWSDAQIKEAVDYSHERGVGLWFWRHSRELRTPEAREQFFSKLQRLGVAGAKIDFFDHEHKELIDLYEVLLKEAARHKLMVNFHGSNKPTGEPRTYPNELIREGVRGMEASRLQARARHNTTLPFTRYLAGHGDYTPTVFGARRGDTTWAHQVATAAVFNQPLLTYGAHPTNLLNHPALGMIKSIPAVWDETIVLPASEISEVAAFARRSSNTWFLAVLNGSEGKKLVIPLSFLGSGDYRVEAVRDDAGEPAAVLIDHFTSRRSDKLDVQLSSGGGFMARFESANAP